MQRGRREGCTPRHSVRLNLLTRFHRPRWQPRGRLPPRFPSPPCHLPRPFVAPISSLVLLLPPSHRGFMITSARSVRPPVRPSNPSPWNLGWHLVNRERRRHSPFCTNFGLPAASERGPPQTPSPHRHHGAPWTPRSISLFLSFPLSLFLFPSLSFLLIHESAR